MSYQIEEVNDGPLWPLQVREANRHFRTCSACRLRWEQSARIYRLLQDRRRRAEDALQERGAFRVHDGIAYTAVLSPLGIVWIAAGPSGVVATETWTDEVSFVMSLERRLGTAPSYEPEMLDSIATQFDEYFSGQRVGFDFSLDFRPLPPFQRSVLQAVARVPYGTVQSYRDVAIEVGKPLAARAVGTAVASNPLSVAVPCHRIVRSDGSPGEYALSSVGSCGVVYKRGLLEIEGYRFAARSVSGS